MALKERCTPDKIKKAFLSGKLQIGESEFKKWNGCDLKSEPWTSMCFSKADLEQAETYEDEAENYLENCAIEDSEKIAKKEGWKGAVYLYPDESGVEYGMTIFYKALRPSKAK